ncbi:MAG: hypothetical protein ABFC57_15365 [Veillonellales bacterium]
MAIDQNGLNSLLANLMPKNNAAVLREQRTNLMRKLQTTADRSENGLPSTEDTKRDIKELAAVDQEIAQEVYDETSHRLEEQRLEQEAACAKKERDRERALAKHEHLLESRSMSKLLSANSRVGQPDVVSFGTFNNGSQGDNSYISGVDRDLQESIQYGIAAAEVAVRRKNAESKAQIKESSEKCQIERKQKAKHVNISV